MLWECTSYMDWDGGWIGKVPELQLGLWRVLLESAKDRFLGVGHLGQQVLLRVWYGKTC
jgi:hypothetical protein